MTDTKTRRSVPQAVFDSPEARRVQHAAHAAAVRELEQTPANQLDVGNPNHPIHDGLFGQDYDSFMRRQYK